MNKKRIKNGKIKGISIRYFSRLIFLAFYLVFFNWDLCFCVDFITQDEFAAEKSTYKNYPLKILFKKLHESDDYEKRKIRNVIILKQVFDRKMQEKAGDVKYNESFGIITDISNDNIKFLVPETDSFKNFYIGIDRIPVVNDDGYKISESNIGKYAVIAYTLDNRVYKIAISFPLAVPTGLYIKRENNVNIVGWRAPLAIKKPSVYKVFINGKPFSTVKDTVIKIPRRKRQVDEYYVKAIYRHGRGLIYSDASDVLYDEITAKERDQQLLAQQTYSRITAALNPSEWPKAKNLLYDNRQFMTDYLDKEQKGNALKLIEFFRDIDEGDRLSSQQPETIENLDVALSLYKRAWQKAKAMPESIDVLFIAQLKTNENSNRKAILERKDQQLLAQQTYSRITAALNPSEWPKAKNLLYDNRQFMTDYLDKEQKGNALKLIEFFRDIDEGDRLSSQQPETIENLDVALSLYKRAGQKAKAMPESIDVLFIAQLKTNENSNRKAILESRKREILAAKSAKATPKPPSKKPETKIVKQPAEPPAKKYDRSTVIDQALKDFDARNYVSSLNTFMKIFSNQINNIKQSGRRQILGILALPVEIRAEIIFLVELDRLKKEKKGSDQESIRDGLEELNANIEDGRGLWVIISDAKRNRIINHISRLLK